MDNAGRLVLSRRAGEEIVIGEGPGQIVVKVLSVKSHKWKRKSEVQIGLAADKSIPIRRGELREKP